MQRGNRQWWVKSWARQKEYLRLAWFFFTQVYLWGMAASFSIALSDAIRAFTENSVNMITLYAVGLYAGFAVWTFALEWYEQYWLPGMCTGTFAARGVWLRALLRAHARRCALAIVALQVLFFFLEVHVRWWWVWLWSLTSLGIIVAQWYAAARLVIFTPPQPLADTALAGDLKWLAAEAGVRIDQVMFADIPDRRGWPAIVVWRLPWPARRIVLSSGALQLAPEELRAVVCWELAANYFGHWWKELLWKICSAAAAFFLIERLLRLLSYSFGIRTVFEVGAAPLLLALGLIVFAAVQMVTNAMRRGFARQADFLALSLPENPAGLISLLIRLSALEAQEFQRPPKLLYYILHTSPPLRDRLRWAQDLAESVRRNRPLDSQSARQPAPG